MTNPRILPSHLHLAHTTKTSAIGEFEIHVLAPERRYPPPPGASTASVAIPAGSGLVSIDSSVLFLPRQMFERESSRARTGTVVRLGETEAANQFTLRESREVLVFELLASKRVFDRKPSTRQFRVQGHESTERTD